VGTVQATVSEQDGRLTAEIAWVIGTTQQRRGYAREATRTMMGWLHMWGVDVLMDGSLSRYSTLP